MYYLLTITFHPILRLKVDQQMSLYAGFIQLGAGLSVGLAGMAAGFAVGIVGDAGVRASAQQPRLFTGMVRNYTHTLLQTTYNVFFYPGKIAATG